MREEALNYLKVETASSFVVNGILNFLSAYAIFHNHRLVPVAGRNGMFQDAIGETLIVIFLSYLVPALIGRHRRRKGTLPVSGLESLPAGNVYVRALWIAVSSTVVITAVNAILLPRIFGDGVNLRTELIFKTVFGAVFGALASYLAIVRTLHETDAASGRR